MPEKDKRMVEAVYVTSVTVKDPNGIENELEIWWDPETDVMVGIDAAYLEQVNDTIPSPYNPNTCLSMSEELLEKATAEAKRGIRAS